MTKKKAPPAPSWQAQDPNYQAESRKYHQPIPSREFILQTLEKSTKSLSLRALSNQWLLDDEQEQALSVRLNAMERQGQVQRNKRQGFSPTPPAPKITGRVHGNAEGHGFLVPDDDSSWIYLSPADMKTVFHGDRVSVEVYPTKPHQDRRQGRIIDVLERKTDKVVGRYAKQGAVAFVTPENKRLSQQITLSNANEFDAEFGDLLLVQITAQPSKKQLPMGTILKRLGDDDTARIETTVAIHNHDIPHEWPAAVTEEIKGIPDAVDEADKVGRTDFRKLPLVTIDGIDAKDFDDAVYCEKRGDNYRLLVAIADVSHYVKVDQPLDAEAENRGTSVYFPSTVIPMLPEKLSNGLCSLNPKVDRLCMVCEMTISPAGKVLRSKFHNGVMHSHARFTYETVWALLQGDDQELVAEYADLLPHLQTLYDLYKVLRASRDDRGAIDFDFPEPEFEFSADGKISAINARVRNDAHKLIEECMIAANIAAARFLGKNKQPSLYRIHPPPSPDKLEQLREYVRQLGLTLGGGAEPSSKDLQQVLVEAEHRTDIEAVQTRLLRSMMQAEYNPDNIGHFGLGLQDYAHFTSPIRRYPDLLVHRGIRHLINDGTSADFQYSEADMIQLGEHCSETERRADEATREAADWLKCQFMSQYIGETFEGKISGITHFGIFVTLDDFFIDGLVHISEVGDDYFEYDEVMQQLVGRRSGRTVKLGEKIQVLVAKVNLEERQIDFMPVSDDAPGTRGRKPTGKSRKPIGKPTGKPTGKKATSAHSSKPSGKKARTGSATSKAAKGKSKRKSKSSTARNRRA